jgi:hypothetical protein
MILTLTQVRRLTIDISGACYALNDSLKRLSRGRVLYMTDYTHLTQEVTKSHDSILKYLIIYLTGQKSYFLIELGIMKLTQRFTYNDVLCKEIFFLQIFCF